MTTAPRQFEPGTLWRQLIERTRQALACGALQPIETQQRVLEEAEVPFVVRRISSLARKHQERPLQPPEQPGPAAKPNPFSPYDPDLHVADLSETHVGLLNKFQVIDHHLLIVTREFQEQESVLLEADFQALSTCLSQFEGLAFYNGGTVAGASQPHKHLQIVPLPLSKSGFDLPIQPRLRPLPAPGEIGQLEGIPFWHAVTGLDRRILLDPGTPRLLHRWYLDLLRAVSLDPGTSPRQAGPYNLLATRDWMLIVPRRKECFEGISINALGFAGSFFVRNQDELRLLEQHRPWRVLSEVGCPLNFP